MPAKGFGGNNKCCRCFNNIKNLTMKQVCILFVLVCFGFNSNAQISINGKVLGSDNEPLTGAHVFIGNNYYRGVTDNNGNFKFEGIRPGKYQLTISYIG